MFSFSSLQIIVSTVLKSLSVSFNICFIFWSDLFFPLSVERRKFIWGSFIFWIMFIVSRIRILICKDSRFCDFFSVNIISFVSTVNFFWLCWNCRFCFLHGSSVFSTYFLLYLRLKLRKNTVHGYFSVLHYDAQHLSV